MSDGPTSHLLSLKVMRVSRPTIASAWQPFYSSSPSFSAHSTESILSLQGKTPLPGHPKTLRDLSHATDLLNLPASFGTIQLGETFSCCLSVNNESASQVGAITLKVEIQTATSKVTLAEFGGTDYSLSSGDTLEDIIRHEIKELGQHVLACTVSYRMATLQHGSFSTDTGSDPSLVSFRKFYKFVVTNPLSVKTKVHTPRSPSALMSPEERDKVFLEVHIQNLAPDSMWFESMRFEAVEGWVVLDSTNEDEKLFCGSMALMQPQDMRQHIYTLRPSTVTVEQVVHAPGAIIPLGRLDLAWRSSFGEPGRLLTSMLSRRIPLPPQPIQAPASAVPHHLKRGTVSGGTPTRSMSPQLPQSRPSSPTPTVRASSPIPTRARTQSIISSRAQSPPPSFSTSNPLNPSPNTIEASLAVQKLNRESVCAGQTFPIHFALALSSRLPPERRGQTLKLSLVIQHTSPHPITMGDHQALSAPQRSLIDVPTPKATVSPGFSTPSPVYTTFNYALAYQKLAAQDQGHDCAPSNVDGGTVKSILPPPHSVSDRRQLTGGVAYSGSSAIVLPMVELKEHMAIREPALHPQVTALLNFELSFLAIHRGFQNVGGLRLLLMDETFMMDGEAVEPKLVVPSEAQVVKEWDVVAEVWVS